MLIWLNMEEQLQLFEELAQLLSRTAEDLERATGLIQDAAASRPDGPSSSELEAAAALIQGVAPRP